MSGDTPLLRVAGLGKCYGAPVLVDFEFELQPGEVHALIGGNGAGKSTFARILCGLTPADTGELWIEGRSYAPRSKRDAENAGIVLVLQELNLVGTLSVGENLFLNCLPRRAGFVCYTALRSQARRALDRVGLGDMDPSMPAAQLGVGHQQLVEIAGALAKHCRLLILDEPTAALTGPEIERLFDNIRRLQSEGVGIIYITHRLDEIRRIANRVTVMRDGRRVASHHTTVVTSAELVREMAGHDLPEREAPGPQASGEIALRIRHLCAGPSVRDVSFEVRRGEILGLAGLIGSGRSETLRAIFGADPKESGEIHIGNDPQPRIIRAPADAVRAGVGMVPEDRKRDGLLLPQSVRVNTTLATLSRHSLRAGWLNTRTEAETTDLVCKRLGVRCTSREQAVVELSGGNQQKVLVARWLVRDCPVLLFDEPTRGIDVEAKDTMGALLRDLASEGKGIVVVSSELVELMALCHRIVVMCAGRINAEFLPSEWTQEKITKAAFGDQLSRPECPFPVV